MHPYVFVPLSATIAAVAIAGALWSRDPRQPINRLSATLMLSVALWSLADAFSHAARTPQGALLAGRLAAFGFLWIGPLVIDLHRRFVPDSVPRWLHRGLPALYALTLLWIALSVFTPLFISEMTPLPWGWAPAFGPLLPVAVLWSASYPTWIAMTSHRNGFGRHLGPVVSRALLALVTIALATEVALPLLGLPVPSVATAAVSLAAGLLVLEIYRAGRNIVTPRHLAQELLDAFPDGVALRNPDGTIRSANENLAKLVGCPRDRLRGVDLARFLPDRQLHGAAGDTTTQDLQTSLTTLADETIPVSVSTSLLVSRDGAAIGRVVAIRDQRPVLELRGHLITAGRLAAVGELAASITHEINNPVAFVRTNLGLLDQHLQKVSKAASVARCSPELRDEIVEAREIVAETLTGAEQVAAIVRNVRSFSGAGHQEHEVVDVNRLCEEALRVSLPHIPDGVSIQREYRDVLGVPSDPRALVQVFLNLITNAAHAVAERGTIWISTEPSSDGPVVRVADDGAGIPPGVVERIFDPFFTTKPVGEGTGLGLAISRQIIEHHGGTLEVEDRPGGGTTFVVRLPTRVPPLEHRDAGAGI